MPGIQPVQQRRKKEMTGMAEFTAYNLNEPENTEKALFEEDEISQGKQNQQCWLLRPSR